MSSVRPVVATPEQRWEQGIPHDARSEELYGFIAEYDYERNNDRFGFKAGGDGDNGEELMYLLDEYFAHKDTRDEAAR